MIVGVIGSGSIGPDLAYGFVSALASDPDSRVLLHDIKPEALEAGLARIQGYVKKGVDRGKLNPKVAAAIGGMLATTENLADLADCDYVLEAATEDLAIKKIRRRKTKNKTTLYFWRNLHSNKLVIFSFIPIFLLLVTGVILDHPDFFRSFLKTTKLSISYLPPVYRDLSTDIWGIDYDGAHYRIGNRLGVFKSADLKNWSLASTILIRFVKVRT